MRSRGLTDLDLLEGLFGEHLGSPFFVKDASLRYVAANRAMARLCGLSNSRELLGLSARDVFPASLAEHFESLDRAILANGRPMTNVLESFETSNEAPAWLLFARLPVRDLAGNAVGVAASARRLPSSEVLHACYRRVQLATKRLRCDLDDPLAVRRVADAVGVSMTQMERDFLKVLEMSPRTFLQTLRLDRARALLEDASLSIASVAHACGYTDHSAFSRRFRSETGTTPKAYRRGLR